MDGGPEIRKSEVQRSGVTLAGCRHCHSGGWEVKDVCIFQVGWPIQYTPLFLGVCHLSRSLVCP